MILILCIRIDILKFIQLYQAVQQFDLGKQFRHKNSFFQSSCLIILHEISPE